MHDGIELEIRGRPAAVLITQEFVLPARTIAGMRGIPDYPFAVVGHPIGSLDEEGITERAQSALPQVLELLAPAGKYRGIRAVQ